MTQHLHSFSYIVLDVVLNEFLATAIHSVTNNSNNSYYNLDLVWLNLDSEKVNCACRRPLKFEATPRELDLSRDHACASYFFSDVIVEWTCSQSKSKLSYELFNYFFTEISFYPETSSQNEM